jgi:hypothetical protein
MYNEELEQISGYVTIQYVRLVLAIPDCRFKRGFFLSYISQNALNLRAKLHHIAKKMLILPPRARRPLMRVDLLPRHGVFDSHC